MKIALFDLLTDKDIRNEDALKQYLVDNVSSGTPWLVAEIPA